jgi:hypothetical protein
MERKAAEEAVSASNHLFKKTLLRSLVVVENAPFLWFNANVLRLNAPLVLLAFEMK